MATIKRRDNADGTTTYRVRWQQGGRTGGWQSEKFGDETSAEEFKQLVDAHGQQWPPGWVKGKGFVQEPAVDGDMPLTDWAHRYVDRLTGIDERTRHDYKRDIDNHFAIIRHVQPSGLVVEATIANVTADDIQDWVRAEEAGERDPGNPEAWLRRKSSPKSIANRHGLLSAIVQAAVESDPPRRSKNCCTGTRLPRVDDGIDDEMCFLEHDEYARIAAEIQDPHARDLADWLVGTGMRWGEATALQVRDVSLTRSTVSVQRAWKRAAAGDGGPAYFLGPPKTKKARRVIALSPLQMDMLRRRMAGKAPEGLLFETPRGKSWRHDNFWRRRWVPAVEAAIAKGLPKRPRIHDLRHTHVAWLIAERIPLPAIQARLGHESITTTVDRYGHLVQALDGEIRAAVEAAMGPPAAASGIRRVV
ncbi:Site-specific recombinase XerD [Streptomyces misionensis]|uniref:Site-specific recombinase XerD n=1 Tax=Streptomyces misionensis TaxID=67331 RepID=A0A1H4P355_9ACTN|nr:site-specific integrase [Streptomyces misionensis]SEC01735.1 Site-specific recombinase XerD [Streptomyces misionensis]